MNDLTKILSALERIEAARHEDRELLEGINASVIKLAARVDALEADGAVYIVEPTLCSRALELQAPEDPHVILCLDFGTARSKAFAASADALFDLALGQRAGAVGASHSLLSCIFISDDGLIHFGEAAAEKSEVPVARGERERLDSIKAMVTNSAPGADLTSQHCRQRINPTSMPLTDGDLLTLYLAYLTDMAVTELTERHGVSRYVSRRITAPVFPPKQQHWANEVIRQHYSEALLVADQFTGRWSLGIPVLEALGAVRAARKVFAKVAFLTHQPVVEPIASFAARYRGALPERDARGLFTVVDAGAGTTDFATFAVVNSANDGLQMFTIGRSVSASKKAGNEVDRILATHILDTLRAKHQGLDDADMTRIRASLSLQQRRIKEDLFSEGHRSYDLSDGTSGHIVLDEFMALPQMIALASELRSAFEQSLKAIDSSWFRGLAERKLYVVATGGSSSLPMIRDIAASVVNLDSLAISCVALPAVPLWVPRHYPELVQQFRQLAVAVGGCQQHLPGSAPEHLEQFGGLRDEGPWHIPPVRRGS